MPGCFCARDTRVSFREDSRGVSTELLRLRCGTLPPLSPLVSPLLRLPVPVDPSFVLPSSPLLWDLGARSGPILVST